MPAGFIVKLNLGFGSPLIPRIASSSLFNSSNFSVRRSLGGFSMASQSVLNDIHVDDIVASRGNGLDLSNPSGAFFGDKIRASCLKSSVRMISGELPKARLVCGYSRKGGFVSDFVARPLLKSFSTLSPVQFAASGARDMSFDGNEEPVNSTLVSGQTLKLISGSCYMPHPDKEATGGEDAHFICEEQQVIGVADGVGGWAEVGINAGNYARELMSNSVSAIEEEPKGSIDPFRVLEKAHLSTKAKGSSTACIIALMNEEIHAINLGDSGFMVVRDGTTVFESPVQQHSFNFTYQLDSGGHGDLPSSGQIFKFPVSSGDIIIAGTDGLFDNLYSNEITAVVAEAARAGLEPQATAQKIAALARQRALDRTRQTPFSSEAQKAGYQYFGGKLDDLTVVVSYIRSSNTA